MIEVIYVPLPEAIATAKAVIKALGENHELSIKWIDAVRRYDYRWRPDLQGCMRSV